VRVLSPHSGYSLQVLEPKEQVEHDPITGQAYTRTDTKAYIAAFEESATGGGLFPHEREAALKQFAGSFKGLPEGTNPLTRIGVWDSEAAQQQENWSDEYREAIEKRVIFLASQRPTRCLVVDMPKAPKPWPLYDEQDEDEIVAFAIGTGIDPEIIVKYELEQDHPRFDLVTALRTQDADAAETGVVATVSG